MGAATVIAGVTLAMGAAKAISGAKQTRDGKRAARRFKRSKLKNTETGRRVSRLGADLAREEAARATASTVDVLKSGGIRGSVGGAAGVVGANNRNSRAIGAGLDQQQLALDAAIAADERRIQALQEGRDVAELSNLQQQVNAGNQQVWSGLGDVASGIGGLASSGAFDGSGKGKKVKFTDAEQAAMDSYNPDLGVANSVARNTFGDTAGAFGGSPINPLTGKPYGIV